MATKSGPPIGPFPDRVETDEQKEEYDKLRRRVLWKMPSGLYVVGARDGDRRNGMTLNWATQVSFEPKLLGISVEKEAFTHELIAAGKVFSLNMLPQEERAAVRKFVKPVEVDADGKTLNGYAFHDGRTGAPILDVAAAWVDCELRQSVDCGGHTFFIGEVVDVGFQADEETPVLRMEDTRMSYGG
jgi:flavin reductase (DIM6/NTAB) family NADH-FMN oxidoreductase RutF